MKKSIFLLIILWVSIGSGFCNSLNNPNILVLFVDDLGYNDVGFRNSKFYTPNIDNLASEGMVFNNGYVPSPTCSPSRAALYTGQHPARLEFYRHIPENVEGDFNLWDNDSSLLLSRNYLPLNITTYAEVAKAKGYHTCFVGKWHLGEEEFGPDKQGWEKCIANPGAGHPLNYYTPFFRGKGFWNDIPEEQYLTDYYTDEVVGYIEKYNEEKPFLIQLSYNNVHTPNIGKKEFRELYQKKGFEGKLIEYGAQVSAVDESIGRILNALKKTGKDKNTLIIFTSDQGSFFPNTPLRGTKAVGTTLYEGGQKVPFIMKWDGKVSTHSYSDIHVQTTDIFPTICEVIGVNPSKYQGLEGESLLGVITKNKSIKRKAIFAFRSYDSQYASVLQDDNWKLVAYRDGNHELYKVDEDISETNNLAKKYPEKVDKLYGQLEKWLKKTNPDLFNTIVDR